jgi:hypothetical protein
MAVHRLNYRLNHPGYVTDLVDLRHLHSIVKKYTLIQKYITSFL